MIAVFLLVVVLSYFIEALLLLLLAFGVASMKVL